MTELEQVDADILALEAAKRQLLLGKRRVRVNASEGGVEYSAASLTEINQEIAVLRIRRGRLTGTRSGVGPIGIVVAER